MSSSMRQTTDGPSSPMNTDVHRVIPAQPFESLDDYALAGGGAGLRAARATSTDVVLDELEASGLRGRGGAGFPTATKWRTVMQHASNTFRTSVIVNAAEGEPGTFKDRAILRANPYAVIEGALIAAHVVGSRSVTFATKQRFGVELARLRAAIDEVQRAGWCAKVQIEIVEGPAEYLFGEETALLEVVEGRPPFPRIAPPWRRGSIELVRDPSNLDSGSGLAADIEMATEGADSVAPPALVNNVETLANVPAIIALGAAWFRSIGTMETPGTVVCTISGDVPVPTVIEVAAGEPLRSLLDRVGDPKEAGLSPVLAVLMGVSNKVLTAAELDTPISYEGMKAIGGGLGSATFTVVDARTDPLALAAGVSRFLAVESCGQCTPCKQDGLNVFERLRLLGAQGGTQADLATIRQLLGSIADGARCNLAAQHQLVVGGIMDAFDDAIQLHLRPDARPCEPVLITELMSLEAGTASVDELFLTKRSDWTYDANAAADTSAIGVDDPGVSPAERQTDHRAGSPAPTPHPAVEPATTAGKV